MVHGVRKNQYELTRSHLMTSYQITKGFLKIPLSRYSRVHRSEGVNLGFQDKKQQAEKAWQGRTNG